MKDFSSKGLFLYGFCMFFGLLPLPGHGGNDPGKIGAGQVFEKDINLSIARKVQQYLEAQDIRVALIEEAHPAITVSIHQNSYPEEYVCGAQVFFYDGSKEGQKLGSWWRS